MGWHRDGFNIAYYRTSRKKKVENLARTGTEYPIAKMQHTFIPDHPAQEPFSKQ